MPSRRLPRLACAAAVLLLVPPRAGATDVPSPPDSSWAWRMEREPSECIGFLPKPGCGHAPADAGERGGALQGALFVVLMGALGTVLAVIAVNTVRRDRARVVTDPPGASARGAR